MIEANTIANQLQIIAPDRTNTADARDAVTNGAGFSFALAAASLETQAAQSLETHGAAPSGAGSISAPSTGDAKTGAQGTQSLQTVKLQQDTPVQRSTPQQEQPAAQQATSQPTPPAPQLASTLPTQPAVVSIAVANAPVPTTPAQIQPSPQRNELSALRTTDTTRTDTLKTARPAAPTARPEAPTQDFARLLARRLDSGATQFDLRLDPPELGKVEANLKVSEKGENVLALKFEHQSTLDLFSRDDAALRTALSSSGFDLGRQQLSFSLAEALERDAPNTPEVINVTTHYDPKFIAAWSTGAIDISL